MRARSLAPVALLALLGCHKNTAPAETDPGAAAAPAPAAVAVAPTDGAAAHGGGSSAPLPRTKVDLMATDGRFSYAATGGKSPYEKIECTVSWKAGGADGKAVAEVVARPGRFQSVKQPRVLDEARLREGFAFLDFDPMALDTEQARSGATDMHSYTLTMSLGDASREVKGYGLADGSDFARLIEGLDDLCQTDAALDASRAGG